MSSNPAPSSHSGGTGSSADHAAGRPSAAQALADVRALAAADAAGLDDDALSGELVELRRLADVAEAAYLERLRVFDDRGVSASREVLNTRQWARHRLNVAPAETSRGLKIARALEHTPVIRDAFTGGQIRPPHAAAITEAITQLGPEPIIDSQHALVEAAATNDPGRLRAALRGLGAAIGDRDRSRRAAHRDHDRWLDIATTFNGNLTVNGVLDPESGAIVHAAIAAHTPPPVTGDTRPATVRRADALTHICATTNATSNGSDGSASVAGDGDNSSGNSGNGSDGTSTSTSSGGDSSVSSGSSSGDDSSVSGAGGGGGGCECRQGGRSGNRPSILVICDLATLTASSGGYGELAATGDILPGAAVRRLACDAVITRIITGPGCLPLDVGRAQRTLTGAQLKALRIRDGGCRFPGCDRPVEWCDAHHIRHWAHGGTTDLNNLILLCRHHHTTVHECGWTIHTRDNDYEFHTPTGENAGTGHNTPIRDLIHNLTQPRAGPLEHV